jgi:hypothetical protein
VATNFNRPGPLPPSTCCKPISVVEDSFLGYGVGSIYILGSDSSEQVTGLSLSFRYKRY